MATYSDWVVHPSQTSTSRSAGSNKAFFDKLEGFVKSKADEVVRDHVYTMKNTLRYRFPLGKGDGRYPRWDYTFDNKQKSKGSYKHWQVVPKGDGKYVLHNDATGWGGYAYALPLISGKGWNKRHIEGRGGPWDRLVRNGNKIFSKQMPNGLDPWLRRKKKELNIKLEKEIGSWT